MDKFSFSPMNGLNDASAFPDPRNETETREQLQRLHNQTRDYINSTLVPEMKRLNEETTNYVKQTVEPKIAELNNQTKQYITQTVEPKIQRLHDENKTYITDTVEPQIKKKIQSESVKRIEIQGGTLKYATDDTGELITIKTGEKGQQGEAGKGFPQGGLAGQALVKRSNTDYDTEWKTIATEEVLTEIGQNSFNALTKTTELERKLAETERKTETNKQGLSNLTNIVSKISGTKKTVTLSAGGWVGKVYTVRDSLITATSNQDVMPVEITNPPTQNDIEYIGLYQSANLVSAGQRNGELYLCALGEVPKQNLNIQVIFENK